MFLVCNILLYFFAANYFVSGRNLNVNLYSVEEQRLFRGFRTKRAVDFENYCSTSGCCSSRNDECSYHYSWKNTTCYCDNFCDQESEGHIDCCPDFWLACKERDYPVLQTSTVFPTLTKEGCWNNGINYEDNTIIKDNCNYCTCLNNHWVCTDHVCLVRDDLIEEINKNDYGWKAASYSQFWGLTLYEGIKYRLGTIKPSPSLLNMNEMTRRVSLDEDFPLFFISSYKWPQYIHGPLDQKNCAASWAFSTASVAADRIAIHSGGRFTSNLSPQHLISCNIQNQNGCNGGNVDGAWSFLRKRGLVSYSCYPYVMDKVNEFAACNMSTLSDEYGKRYANKQCPNSIEDSNNIYQCSPAYRIPSDEREIMKEIMENGPVQAVMQVDEDFFLYKTGIYKHTNVTNNKPHKYQMSDTHSVKIVGWGALKMSNGKKEKFWIAANSWGNSWGENGYFRILRGENESGIENIIIAAWCHI
ncbi:tubulointerstitial nephritis antigen [Bombina bombina]|uniref:tubulointerstitial nephritis antigen n=1 Tax=Bombina bombina TaxID=8345 RepID=UPI00235A937A|nr:tubulointerstitial nephritis antigen [Bombina bombina]